MSRSGFSMSHQNAARQSKEGILVAPSEQPEGPRRALHSELGPWPLIHPNDHQHQAGGIYGAKSPQSWEHRMESWVRPAPTPGTKSEMEYRASRIAQSWGTDRGHQAKLGGRVRKQDGRSTEMRWGRLGGLDLMQSVPSQPRLPSSSEDGQPVQPR